MANVKPSQLVDNPKLLEQSQLEGGDGKPFYKFVEENTDNEDTDSAIETKDVRNWRSLWWDKARKRINVKWVQVMEEQQRITKTVESPLSGSFRKLPSTLAGSNRKLPSMMGSPLRGFNNFRKESSSPEREKSSFKIQPM